MLSFEAAAFLPILYHVILSMYMLALVLACLGCTGHGRRVKMSRELLPGVISPSGYDTMPGSHSLAELELSQAKMQAESRRPLEVLALLLMDPTKSAAACASSGQLRQNLGPGLAHLGPLWPSMSFPSRPSAACNQIHNAPHRLQEARPRRARTATMTAIDPEHIGMSRLIRSREIFYLEPGFGDNIASLCVAGSEVSVIEESMAAFDSGSRVWDAGVALAVILGDDPATAGLSIVEIGSGTGIAGLSAAAAGADVVLTDRADSVDLLNRNVALNLLETRVLATELTWGYDIPEEIQVRGPFDLIIGSELLYRLYDEDLLKTLVDLSTPGKTEVLLTFPKRHTEETFFANAADYFEEVSTYEVVGFGGVNVDGMDVGTIYCTRLRRTDRYASY